MLEVGHGLDMARFVPLAWIYSSDRRQLCFDIATAIPLCGPIFQSVVDSRCRAPGVLDTTASSIGFGTTSNVVMDCWGEDPFGSPGSKPASGGSFGSTFDEVTLKQIAEMTGGRFYSATNAAELHLVFQKLHSYMALTNQTTEVSVYFAALGVILGIIAWLLSFFWHPVL